MQHAPRVGTLGSLLRQQADLAIYCYDCPHGGGTWNIDELVAKYGADLPVETFCQRLRCTKCGRRGGDIRLSIRRANWPKGYTRT